MLSVLEQRPGGAEELLRRYSIAMLERIERSTVARPVLTRLYREVIGAEMFDELLEHVRTRTPELLIVCGSVAM